jgi:hypothetical protein
LSHWTAEPLGVLRFGLPIGTVIEMPPPEDTVRIAMTNRTTASGEVGNRTDQQ